MARRDGAVSTTARSSGWSAPHPGTLVAAALGLIYLGALLSLLSSAETLRPSALISPYLLRVLWSSLAQAVLSTTLALIFGGALALAIARMRRGAALMRALILTMAVAPTIVIVLGVATVYGRAGWAATLLGADNWPSIYGLSGILIAHVALNAPFAARVFLHALGETPAEHHRVAAVCGCSPWQVFRLCDWPALKREIPGLATLIMLLCFTSFAAVITLGGGPANATLEVAIYEALRVEVDFGRAALLAILQIIIVCVIVALARRALSREPATFGAGRMMQRADAHARTVRVGDGAILFFFLAALAPILVAPLAGGASLATLVDADIGKALITSIMVAVPAALLCVAIAIALAARPIRNRDDASSFPLAPLLALAVPPFALVAGLYGPLRRFGDNAFLAMILVPFINGLTALPFAYRLIEPALRQSRERYGKLAAHLDIRGASRLRIIDWPLLRRPFFAAFTMAFALSLGDFGVAALFSGQDFRTLPLLLHERMGAYRMAEAQAIAFIMLGLAFVAAFVTERFADAANR